MSNIHKSFVLQQDQSDCGVSCLLSIIKYYDGYDTLENLRRLSGTNTTGTTMLGLYQTAQKTGFEAHGCQSNMDLLTAYDKPCILYANQNHYVVYYGTIIKKAEVRFIIGDPAKGIILLDRPSLNNLWETKKCLTLVPNEAFKKVTYIKNEKRKWIVGLLKEDTQLLTVAILLGVIIAVLGLVMTIFSQRLIDEILPKRQIVKFIFGTVLAFILLLLREGLAAIRQYFLLRQSKDFNVRIIDFFYSHLLKLPKYFFGTRKIGELTARLNDTNRIQRVISQFIGNIIIDGLVVIVTIALVFIYSWQVGIACVIALPVFFQLIRTNNKNILAGQRDIMNNYARTEANYISTLLGIDVIKSYNKEAIFGSSNKDIYRDYQDSVFLLSKIQIKLSFWANSFGASFLIGILLFTGYQVLHNHLKVGELIAILGMCGSLLPSVSNIALFLIPLNEAKIVFDRMFEFTSADPEDNKGKCQIIDFKNLQVHNVSFRFTGRPLLIKDISFEISKGEVIAIIGENGCGKSTLMEILQRHYPYESGSIIINDDAKLDETDLKTWRRLVGIVPQQVHLFNGTVLENIGFEEAAINPEHVIGFLHDYGFSAVIDGLPLSHMTIIGEGGVNLSGGQRQLVALARVLYHKPQLLILDEATSAMDKDSERFLIEILKRLKHEVGIIFITHKLQIIKSFCDRIYIIENGNLTQSGTHEELLCSQNLYSSFWNDYN